jgi:1-acyl-sn-glycerol-3-phosphate acyltransferase
MAWIGKLFHRLFSFYCYVVIILSAVTLGLALLVVQPIDRRTRIGRWLTRLWGRTVLFFSAVRVRVMGAENIRTDEAHIFCSNHASYYDVLVLLAHLTKNFRWFARRDLFDVPVMGQAMWIIGHLPVYRDSPRASLRILMLGAKMAELGVSMLIFPEGTRSPDGRLHEFLEGGFHLAVKSGRPVVPVAVTGTFRIMSRHNLLIRPGRVRLIFGRPIPTAGLDRRDSKKLMNEVRDKILTMMETGRPA